MEKINKILLVVGTRPNFIKMQSLIKLFLIQNFTVFLCTQVSIMITKCRKFFNDLEIPEPNFFLKPNLKNHVTQVSSMMEEFDKVVQRLNLI